MPADARPSATVLADDVRELLREQLEYRELLLRITLRDLLLRYKQTAMGVAWALFMPLLNTAMFSVIFTRVAPLDTGMPYPLYAYCGLVTWNWFASSTRFAITSLTSNATLVTKVYFPREALPFSAVIVGFVDLAVASTVLVAMMTYYGVRPGWALLFLPVVLLVQLLFTAGIALLGAMGNLFYRDVKYLFEVVITVWMFGTSVVYPVDRIGGRLATVLALNPLTPIIDAYRSVLLEDRLPAAASFGGAALAALVLFAGAWILFHRAEFRFAESI
jgi:ABC-type polysaccharide/polyol phosphate export permease